MAQNEEPAIYSLPDELLLQITDSLRARTSAEQLQHLAKLCLVSKKLLPIAQEQLYTASILPISCGCHPKVSSAVQFLRTLLDRPDLAPKVKALRFSIVRRRIGKLYSSKGFNLTPIRDKCFAKLGEFGYDSRHPWWTCLHNDLESAYGGVLLSILPNLDRLDFAAKDHHRGYPTLEPISAFFGTAIPPRIVVHALARVQSFVAADLTFVRDVGFEHLRVLDLKRVDIGTVLRLNGPDTLRGATQLEEMSLGVSVLFLDEEYLVDMQVALGDVFAALGCKNLTRLDIVLGNDGYSLMGVEREFRVDYFMRQLKFVSSNLRILTLDLDPHEASDEWLWFFRQISTPMESCKFPKLERMKIPQGFLFQDEPISGNGIIPSLLPPTLRRIDVVAPDGEIVHWANLLVSGQRPPNLTTVCLHCREGINVSKAGFSRQVSVVWKDLEDVGIESLICDTSGEENSLSQLYDLDPEPESSEDWGNDIEDDDSDTSGADDLPELEEVIRA